MADGYKNLDLELWLDKTIIPRQNRLKAKFWNILSDVGNEIDLNSLHEIHAKSRGLKLSKGNDLLGYPYQVLDLIRDFSTNDGLNIRVLNWFGHGLFLFVLIGKNHFKAPLTEFSKYSWQFDLSETPWDYPEIILKRASINAPTLNEVENAPFYQWHKAIEISSGSEIKGKILDELKNLNQILSEKMG